MSEFDVRPPDLDDEVMTSGGLPRWAAVVAALVAVALAATLVQRSLSGGKHTAVSRPTATATRPATPPATVAFDLAATPQGTWLLQTHTLAQVSGTRVTRSVALRGLVVPARSVPMLAVDSAANRVWVVLTNAAPARMIEFDATTLHRVRDVTWARLVQDAAAVGDYLYLSTGFGVAGLAPGAAHPHFVGGLAGATGPMVVDAARNRIIAMDLGYPTDIWSAQPGRRPFEAAMPVSLRRGTVAVVGNSIWVAGYGDHGALLLRLNPATLEPAQNAPALRFGSGAVLVGTGSKVLWLRSGDGGNELACVNATTGRVEQTWRVDNVNAVSSDRSGALVATPSGVLGLVLSGCTG